MKEPQATEPESTTPEPASTAHSALAPRLQLLIDRGTLTSVQAAEAVAFDEQVGAMITAGEMTPAQAAAMGRMLGLRYSAERQQQSGRRSLQ